MIVEVEHGQGSETLFTPSIFVGNNAAAAGAGRSEEAEDIERHRLAAVIVEPVGTAESSAWLGIRGMLGHLGADERIRNFPFQ